MLALVMILAMIPPVHIHAEETAKFILTDQSGNTITDGATITTGDPIYIQAGTAMGQDWFGIYRHYDDNHYDSYYYMWQYADELSEPTALADCIWWSKSEAPDGMPHDGMYLEPGTYELWYAYDNGSLTEYQMSFTLVAPEERTPTLEVASTTLMLGEPIQITATNDNAYSWVGVYSGNLNSADGVTSLKFYYCQGRNGLTQEYTPNLPGEYTVLMYNDYNGTDLAAAQHITVEGEQEKYLSVEKTEFQYNEGHSGDHQSTLRQYQRRLGRPVQEGRDL